MKKYFLLFALLLMGLQTFAQQQITIYSKSKPVFTGYTWDIDSMTFHSVTPLSNPATAEPVDLGLSVKWASFNMGATKAEETGWLVGWADPTGQITSDKIEYYPQRIYTSDIISTNLDIAKSIWGDEWRLPSLHEIEELITNCTWQKTDKGFWATAKNGNKIFFPLTGSKSAEESNIVTNAYWTGCHDGTENASILSLTGDKGAVASAIRSGRCAVRPVYGIYRVPVSVAVSGASDVTLNSAKVTLSLSGYVKDIKEFGIKYSATTAVLDSKDNSNDIKTIPFTTLPSDSSHQEVTVSGLEEGKTYHYIGYAVVGDSLITSKVAQFSTLNRFPVAQAVDLGLPSGTKWASFNLGAQSATDNGGLYGWGDITGELSPSTTSSEFAPGIYDSGLTNIAGNKKYDIIAAKWGSYWQMPTRKQFEELKDETYTTWNVVYDYRGIKGLNGFEIVSNKDNSKRIFLPEAGYLKDNGTSTEVGETALYWTSEFYRDETKGYGVRLVGANDIMTSAYAKPFHISIRGVYCQPIVYPADSAAAKNVKAVDLGLSVDWADQNIRSAKDATQDAFFSWGNVKEQTAYDEESYPYLKTVIDENGKLPKDKDAAAQLWGGTWRMPTIDEWNELINYCKWTKATKNGVVGYNVTGNGNTIFIPLSGIYNNSDINYKNGEANYWTSEPTSDGTNENAYGAFITTDAAPYQFVSGTNLRYLGCLIRPVRDKRQ